MSWKVLLVDEHEVARVGVAQLLGEPPFQVLAAVSTFSEARSCLKDCEIDLVLLDLPLSQSRGFYLLEYLQRHYAKVAVVVLTAHDNPTFIARACVFEARDYLLKTAPVETLRRCLLSIMTEEYQEQCGVLGEFKEALQKRIVASLLPAGFPLTPRESQVLRHLALGLSNKEIASSLDICIETVKEHVQRILRKTNATDRTEVAVRTIKSGIMNDIPFYSELGAFLPMPQKRIAFSSA